MNPSLPGLLKMSWKEAAEKGLTDRKMLHTEANIDIDLIKKLSLCGAAGVTALIKMKPRLTPGAEAEQRRLLSMSWDRAVKENLGMQKETAQVRAVVEEFRIKSITTAQQSAVLQQQSRPRSQVAYTVSFPSDFTGTIRIWR